MAAIDALGAVNCFVMRDGFFCSVLYQLRLDLMELRFGVATPLLTPPKVPAGRKQDTPSVSELKGRIAGIARLQMASGQSRDRGAAAWVARKITSGLASRISSKPFVKASAVKEWMDRYDCGVKILDMFARKDEREAFASLFFVPAAPDKDFIDRVMQQLQFMREHVPENKRRNSIHGTLGFMI